ncbi:MULTISPECIES: sigma-70 family RNA polymerase sigma factor [Intestinimonas]|jgi:RNA polymerase sporulation-specific sigma factor|uniref:RNA polymerase sigma factor SigS n=1 Tax=Intestinimonas massiliensis (ex Afouda et al. 2020) TaxID=1673721 RepID=A0AAW5JNA7_9FIRM|nr:sigma-70 family RNA polymerase sigma factor [Intestinimonas massiliensis (ex Afouda et al. 2020)]MDU1324296.1 sigma-70 family RNA polymerase sigma factor [Clostridiales bacterium]CUQ57488.1 RNA polymerase sigma-H factor [Flavonifractor plautii]SCJ28648.1 Stage 0 sporulation protein H [uncultured Flavonifractor sp.]BDE87425.1 RNA polymerase factor sigma-70 [Oscillospiraceae bacterium]MCQ4771333.1 sigma-70 family RNA polymerase sigma factor [Intestinimonas massiliensis (ex Afouda et al. 2020)
MKSVYTTQNPTADEALCSLAASGDRIAEEALVMRYNRLVRVCARPYFLAGGDSEDLIQEGMVGLLNAIREYDPGKGSSFRTYAETCIRNRILSAIRAAARDKHTPLNHYVSYETPLLDGNTDSYPLSASRQPQQNPEDMLISREERRERLGTLKGQLSGFEAQILDLYLRGLSYVEIASEVDRSPKAVDNAVQRIRRKVAQHLSSGDFSQG